MCAVEQGKSTSVLREWPFVFLWRGWKEKKSKRKSRTNFSRTNIQGRENSLVCPVLYANKKRQDRVADKKILTRKTSS